MTSQVLSGRRVVEMGQLLIGDPFCGKMLADFGVEVIRRIPMRTGMAIGDTLTALHGVIGVLLALYQRDARGGQRQMIDVALYESVFNCMDSMLAEYRACAVIRRHGSLFVLAQLRLPVHT
jgi:crotonobetainyl-CoA:carnitine CoA-transferase CaiB-like acyl-CoA transferase